MIQVSVLRKRAFRKRSQDLGAAPLPPRFVAGFGEPARGAGITPDNREPITAKEGLDIAMPAGQVHSHSQDVPKLSIEQGYGLSL